MPEADAAVVKIGTWLKPRLGLSEAGEKRSERSQIA
jgi:hypothetical protein